MRSDARRSAGHAATAAADPKAEPAAQLGALMPRWFPLSGTIQISIIRSRRARTRSSGFLIQQYGRLGLVFIASIYAIPKSMSPCSAPIQCEGLDSPDPASADTWIGRW